MTNIKSKLVFGYGINDSSEVISKTRNGTVVWLDAAYHSWKAMLERVFSPKWHALHAKYELTSVDDAWRYFSAYQKWYMANYPNDGRKYQLCKDLLIPGNNHYGPKECCFITKQVGNMVYASNSKKRGGTLQGVNIRYGKNGARYIAQYTADGGVEYLGTYDTEKEAHAAYVTAKVKLFLDTAKDQKDKRVKKGLQTHAKLLKDSIN